MSDARSFLSMSIAERVLNTLVAIANVTAWSGSRTVQRAWVVVVMAALAFIPGFSGWVVNHGIALSRCGLGATIANTTAGQMRDAATKKAAQDALDRMKTLPTHSPVRP